jgi:hypothetical protein
MTPYTKKEIVRAIVCMTMIGIAMFSVPLRGFHERLDAVHQVEVIVGFGYRLFAGRAILIFQRADA